MSQDTLTREKERSGQHTHLQYEIRCADCDFSLDLNAEGNTPKYIAERHADKHGHAVSHRRVDNL